ncbi:pantetheine-phosphate adenylyltransferase [uncultured Nocardioides sp.]|uniref:pantetheine-phosphate adenylyltransferase n=1 Tax=uncultured Nocardioides sp. TaxID=198441 RepID=UPI00261ACCE2|nr:pantetheine-phosphate adenylyltransferase [uncultured Nocardioides sp.]
MVRVVCPGSFDPVTLGHVDVVRRAAALFDEVVVAVGTNPSKNQLFTPDERLGMLRRTVGEVDNVRVEGFSGLLTTWCAEQGVTAVVKGLRGAADYDYEEPMAHMNAHLTGLETVLLPTDPRWGFVSSSLVKEVARGGGDVSALVPPVVLDALRDRL